MLVNSINATFILQYGFTSQGNAYNGDGKMVKAVMDGVTTLYVSAVYQVKAV